MINMLPLILGLALALNSGAAPLPEPPLARYTEVAATTERRATKLPFAENGETSRSDEAVDGEDFSADRYGKRESDTDVRDERKTALREKLARDVADFLADYEEYVTASRECARRPRITEARSGENSDGGENAPAPLPPSDRRDRVPRPVPLPGDEPVSPNVKQSPSDDGNVIVVPNP